MITVGSFDFAESGLLAEIYGQALAVHGFRVRIMLELGNRELVDPALMNGLMQVVPEYARLRAGVRQPGSAVRNIQRGGDQQGPGGLGG